MFSGYVFHNPITGVFIKREKRFLSYFYNNQNILLAHCFNTGKMTDLLVPNSIGILSQKNNGKCLYTWETICINNINIGVNTSVPNYLVHNLLKNNQIPGLENEIFQREHLIKDLNYKPDFVNQNIVIEVKNVHWVQNNIAYFPDCITSRGSKQLDALIQLKKQNKRCIIIYIVQRADVQTITIHPCDIEYFKKSQKALEVGIEVLAFNCHVTAQNIYIHSAISFIHNTM
jgi:sugar fermentation stimulation protein A